MDSSGVIMITSIQVYSDVGPWGDWEPFIRAEMKRVGIPESKRKALTVVLIPLSMKPRQKRHNEYKKVE